MRLSKQDWREIWVLFGAYLTGIAVGILIGLTVAHATPLLPPYVDQKCTHLP